MQTIVPQSNNCIVTCSVHRKKVLVSGQGRGYAFRCPVPGCKCKVHLTESEWNSFSNIEYDASVMRRVIIFEGYLQVYFKQ